MTNKFILTLSSPDQSGLSMKVMQFVFSMGGNVIETQQFNADDTKTFFMRVIFDVSGSSVGERKLRESFSVIADELNMDFNIRAASKAKRVLLCVSKFDHCLGDLLYRHRIGELNMEIVGIVSNHPQSVLNIDVPEDVTFHHFPITKKTKSEQEAKIRAVIDETGAELVVLARYMQILSNDFCEFLKGRCINIHHSFLPGFKGARPYHQAYNRGVKMIGATAHFVTSDLDEGPIINQDVELITHADLPEDLIRKGRDVERRVLAQAVTLFLEDRLFLNGSKTIVLG